MRIDLYYRKWDGKTPASHELLNEAAEQYLKTRGIKCPWSFSLAFQENSTGSKKPFFKNMPEVHFSISDSGSYWACAFASEEIGLDIQKIQEVKAQRISRRFFHPLEVKWLEENGWEYFIRIWTLKESYVKYTGRGMSDGLKVFSVIAPSGMTGVYTREPSSGKLQQEEVVQKNIFFLENYEAALTAKKDFTVSIKNMDEHG